MKRECETCIKRKTPYCPTSIDCMATDNMPYYQNRIMLLEENQELKKQLEENQNPLKGIFAQVNDGTLLRDCGNMNAEIKELKTQQKKFIEYMNKTIEELECDDVDDEEMKCYLIQRTDIFKEILSKYKGIIGVSNENNT